jgi:hypothetical protein
MECFKNHGFEKEGRGRWVDAGLDPSTRLRLAQDDASRQLRIYLPHRWGASPPSINLPTTLALRRTSRRVNFGLAEGKATTDCTDYTDL